MGTSFLKPGSPGSPRCRGKWVGSGSCQGCRWVNFFGRTKSLETVENSNLMDTPGQISIMLQKSGVHQVI